MSTPAIVLKSKFVMPSSNGFANYINYIDRDDSKVKEDLKVSDLSDGKNHEFDVTYSYIDYMDDDEKQGELFTSNKDSLSENEKKELKKEFVLAQKNGSPLWQDVISFDNEWLKEIGIFNPDHEKSLDEEKLKDVVRQTMEDLFVSEGMEYSATWSASIHYNTDNIHVHVATVEVNPTREKVNVYNHDTQEVEEQYRGSRKQGSLDRMKSKVVNQLIDRTEQLNKIDGIIRGAVHRKRDNTIDLASMRKTKKLFLKAIENMPDDLRQWKYGYQTINDARPYIDQITEIYLEKFHKEEMKELEKLLDEQVEVSKKLYGDNSNHENYKENQLEDLKKRMGNAVLSEMRNYVKEESRLKFIESKQPKNNFRRNFTGYKKGNDIHYSLMRLRTSMRKTFHDYKRNRNISEFDRMLEGNNYER